MNVDKRYSGTVYPKARPLLHKIGSKDPTDLENAGYVSIFTAEKI